MEDVIFAGTRERKPTGMAEVSLTLVDPEVYDGAALGDGAVGEGDWSSDGSSERALDLAGDWDEAELRKMQRPGDGRGGCGGPAGGGGWDGWERGGGFEANTHSWR